MKVIITLSDIIRIATSIISLIGIICYILVKIILEKIEDRRKKKKRSDTSERK